MKPFIVALPLLIIISFCSCYKEPPVAGNPPVDKHEFIINLNKAYLDGSKTDSAKLTWEHNGKTQTIILSLKDNVLSADLAQFEEGNGKLTVQIFSNLSSNLQYPKLWIYERQMTLEHDKSISLDGPSGFWDADWMPRVMLSDAIGHSAVVALRPEDPYFYVSRLKDEVLELQVNRAYWNRHYGGTLIADGTWSCTSGCAKEKEGVTNTSFFGFLPGVIGNREWNHIEIVIFYVTETTGGGFVLSMNEDVK